MREITKEFNQLVVKATDRAIFREWALPLIKDAIIRDAINHHGFNKISAQRKEDIVNFWKTVPLYKIGGDWDEGAIHGLEPTRYNWNSVYDDWTWCPKTSSRIYNGGVYMIINYKLCISNHWSWPRVEINFRPSDFKAHLRGEKLSRLGI